MEKSIIESVTKILETAGYEVVVTEGTGAEPDLYLDKEAGEVVRVESVVFAARKTTRAPLPV